MPLKTTEEAWEKILIPNKNLNQLMSDVDDARTGRVSFERETKGARFFGGAVDQYERNIKHGSLRILHCQRCDRLWCADESSTEMISYIREKPEQ